MPRATRSIAVLAAACSVLTCADDAPLGVAREAAGTAAWSIVECADFDYDGLGDILWYGSTTKSIEVWLMNGTRLREQGAPIEGPSGTAWRAFPIQEEASDFNLDGMADVLWDAPTRNLVRLWLMRGTRLLQEGEEIEGPPREDGWRLGTLGDFNGDGMAGMLWHNPGKGTAVVWDIAGTHILTRGQPFPAPRGPHWVAQDAFDYNGDFMSDVLWYDASRTVISVWLMRGDSVLERGAEIQGPSGGGWTPIGAPDMNFDHLADLVWFNKRRNVMTVWLMEGTHVLEKGPEIPGPSGGGFTIPALVDFNGDEMADVVWRNDAANLFAVWLMNGTEVLEAGPILPGPDANGG